MYIGIGNTIMRCGSAPAPTAAELALPVIQDTHSKAWFKPYEAGACISAAGVESVYYDMLYGATFGTEQATGDTIVYKVYKITATQVNFFYVGCLVNDIFICPSVVTCDANNKVVPLTGNYLQQYTSANRPINRVFDGSNDRMKSLAFTYNQPAFVYMLLKPLSFTSDDCFFDGIADLGGSLYQKTTTPNVLANAGTASTAETHLTLNEWHIIRALFNGASSKLIIDENTPITGNFGAGNMGGITLGGFGSSVGYEANFEFGEAIYRDQVDSAGDEALLYNYLNAVKATL